MVDAFFARKFKPLLGFLVCLLVGMGVQEKVVLCYEANGNVVLEFAQAQSCCPNIDFSQEVEPLFVIDSQPSGDCGPCVDVPVLTNNLTTKSFKQPVFYSLAFLTVFVPDISVQCVKGKKNPFSYSNLHPLQRVILLI